MNCVNNIKKIYFYYTFNIPNIIIISISILVMMLMFNLYDFDISIIDYNADYINYHTEYITSSLSVFIPLLIVVVILVISIDYMTNHKRFDLIFSSRFSSKEILKIKLNVYLTFVFIYVSFLYLMMILFGCLRFNYFRFDIELFKIYVLLELIGIEAVILINLIMRITKIGFSSILVLILYFLSLIVVDNNKIISRMIFTNFRYEKCIVDSNMFISIIVIIIYYLLLMVFCSKKEFK